MLCESMQVVTMMNMNMNNKLRSYTELSKLKTFEERLQYVSLKGAVGEETFGSNRWINQRFYTSSEWRHARNKVIVRDMGCDLGVLGHEIHGKVIVHHMNPITVDDIIYKTKYLLDPEFLVCVSFDTHELLTFSDTARNLRHLSTERKPYDTCPWR